MRFFPGPVGLHKALTAAGFGKNGTKTPAPRIPAVKCPVREMEADFVKSLLTEQILCPDPDERIGALLQVFRADIIIDQRKMLFLIGDGPALVIQNIAFGLRQMLEEIGPGPRVCGIGFNFGC